MPSQSGFGNAALGSFNEFTNRFDYELDVMNGARDSFNTDASDNSVDSHDTQIAVDVDVDSHDRTWVDRSVNVGNREYNTGFGDLAAGGAGLAAAGNVKIHNHATNVDQSSNSIIEGGFVTNLNSNSAVTASGENSIAAGDDVVSVVNLNDSTNIFAGGDVVMGPKLTETNVAINSFNDVNYESNNWELDVVDSFNTTRLSVDIEDSFTVDSHDDFSDETLVVVDVNAIVGGFGNAILD